MAALILSAPATRHEFPGVTDLSDPAVRAELSRAAVPAMVRLAGAWGLSTEVVCSLLGGIAQSTWYAWKQTPPSELSVDQLTRVSLLLGIYTALHSLFRPPLADEWVKRPNLNVLFTDAAPIELMATGGIVALAAVRAHLDGARGGL